MQIEAKELLGLSKGYEEASILIAAAELDLFTAILKGKRTSESLAEFLSADQRGIDVLLSALVALEILEKSGTRFSVPKKYAGFLDSRTKETLVPMLRHRGSCQRSWCQLAWTVKSGFPAPDFNSINGPLEDYRSFVLAMNSIGQYIAGPLVQKLNQTGLLDFHHLLDLGGASGTYTLEFLAVNPTGKATIFDLPPAIQEAKKRLGNSPVRDRIFYQEGNFYKNDFPAKVDLVWISAIIHQQDEAATEEMFRKSYTALDSHGRIAIRDLFINPQRSGPVSPALFGVNMLVNTEKGRVYTAKEVFQILKKCGFKNPRFAVETEDMSSVIVAEK
ncbi:MAG: methyltransferase [Planctomycetia bacterium]|nr:methyltransferase [Planctomycetia bacterium]